MPNTNLESSKTTDKPYENDREENVYVFKTTPATSLLPEVLNSILPTKPLEDTLKAMTPFEVDTTKRSSEVKKLIFIMPNLLLIMPNSERQLS